MAVPNTPLFVKTHDFNVWLLNHTQRFPKNLRHTYSARLESQAFEFEEMLLMANSVRGKERRAWLERADGRLHCLQALLRYAQDWKLLGGNQVKFASESLAELGRLLGAWLKGTDRN
ncbi:MAG: four helix bundle protein [Planctomycetaceae bacterium]